MTALPVPNREKAAATYTTQGVAMVVELEQIEDAIGDLYSGQDNAIIFKHMDEVGRERIREYLMRDVIQPLRDWHAKYGMENPL